MDVFSGAVAPALINESWYQRLCQDVWHRCLWINARDVKTTRCISELKILSHRDTDNDFHPTLKHWKWAKFVVVSPFPSPKVEVLLESESAIHHARIYLIHRTLHADYWFKSKNRNLVLLCYFVSNQWYKLNKCSQEIDWCSVSWLFLWPYMVYQYHYQVIHNTRHKMVLMSSNYSCTCRD